MDAYTARCKRNLMEENQERQDKIKISLAEKGEVEKSISAEKENEKQMLQSQ